MGFPLRLVRLPRRQLNMVILGQPVETVQQRPADLFIHNVAVLFVGFAVPLDAHASDHVIEFAPRVVVGVELVAGAVGSEDDFVGCEPFDTNGGVFHKVEDVGPADVLGLVSMSGVRIGMDKEQRGRYVQARR